MVSFVIDRPGPLRSFTAARRRSVVCP